MDNKILNQICQIIGGSLWLIDELDKDRLFAAPVGDFTVLIS